MTGTDEQPPSYKEMQRRWAAVAGKSARRRFPTSAIAPIIGVVLVAAIGDGCHNH